MSSSFPTFSGRPQAEPASSADNRDVLIRGFWTFLQGLSAARLRLPGSTIGAMLIVGTDGNVLATISPSGDYSFTGDATFGGTNFIVATTNVNIQAASDLNLSATGSILMVATNVDGSPKLLLTTPADANAKLGLNINALTAQRALRALNLAGAIPLVGDDAPAVAGGSLGKVDLTAQTANIASTALSNTPPAGFYEVEAYLVTTTNDVTAGTLALTVGYTDVGGARTATLIAAHSLTALGPSTGRQLIQLASGNITYAVTVTGIFGSSAYAVYLRVVAKG